MSVKRRIFLCFIFFMIFFIPVKGYAAQTSNVDYSVEPILPANQIKRGNTFFDLKVLPNQKQTLKIKINNFAKTQQTFHIRVNDAQTNSNLVIDYNNFETNGFIGAKKISTMIEYPKTITIPAQKSGIVSLNLSVLNQSFDGILLGGIQVQKEKPKKKTNENTFTTEYDYIIGLMLSENEKKIVPELKFVSVKPSVIENNAGVEIQLQNVKPINIAAVTLNGYIYKDKSPKPVISRIIKNGSIAPESSFKIAFFNGEMGKTKPLEPGNYLLKLTLEEKNGQRWDFEEEFEITKKQAQTVNNHVFVVKKDNTLLYGIMGVLLAILLLLLLLVVKKYKKKQH
ncbi:cell surface protein [Enterococcus saigonensis]|uniref:Cell surface protein n=1 Tax=Enterococcus saigonensis TaxID=1805431 RepID=A0A679IN54_9ENTE|nr:DUF916 and DUF3324 domain-containing protein [Enterococcus saigonensis]BCA86251.1 cell surface protein [Enterococcus saigonensis]